MKCRHTNLPPALQTAATNSNGSFNYSVNARFVTDFGGAKALFMAYGLGNRRFLIWWELNGSGDLTAELEGGQPRSGAESSDAGLDRDHRSGNIGWRRSASDASSGRMASMKLQHVIL